jgi:hypothetical protein
MDSEDDFAHLCAVVHRMVDESGTPTGFDARAWLERWMTEEVPALGFKRPMEVLKEPSGFERIQTILKGMQSGAYF